MTYATTDAGGPQPATEFTFVPELGFRQIAAKVRAIYKHLLGCTVSRKELALLWGHDITSSSFSVSSRGAVDFGLIAVDADALSLTRDGIELCHHETDSQQWLAIAERCIRASKLHSALFKQYGIDASDNDIRLALSLKGIKGLKSWRVDRFLPVFRGSADILRKASGQGAEPDTTTHVAVMRNGAPAVVLFPDPPAPDVQWDAMVRQIVDSRLIELGLLLPPDAA